MNLRQLPPVPYLFYAVGVLLLVAGLGVWWYQNRAIAALEDPIGHVGLAVAATQIPPTSTSMVAAGDLTPSPTATPRAQRANGTRTALPPTSTPMVSPTPSATATPDPFPPSVSAPDRLVIPKIGVDTPVVTMLWEYLEGEDGSVFTEWAVPLNEAGWHVNSETPGNGSNVVVSGHNNVGTEVFANLDQLEPGDETSLFVGEVEYRYVVEEKYILREADMPLEVRVANNEYIQPTEDERLTLVSCWPYETNSHRIVIIARPKVG